MDTNYKIYDLPVIVGQAATRLMSHTYRRLLGAMNSRERERERERELHMSTQPYIACVVS